MNIHQLNEEITSLLEGWGPKPKITFYKEYNFNELVPITMIAKITEGKRRPSIGSGGGKWVPYRHRDVLLKTDADETPIFWPYDDFGTKTLSATNLDDYILKDEMKKLGCNATIKEFRQYLYDCAEIAMQAAFNWDLGAEPYKEPV